MGGREYQSTAYIRSKQQYDIACNYCPKTICFNYGFLCGTYQYNFSASLQQCQINDAAQFVSKMHKNRCVSTTKASVQFLTWLCLSQLETARNEVVRFALLIMRLCIGLLAIAAVVSVNSQTRQKRQDDLDGLRKTIPVSETHERSPTSGIFGAFFPGRADNTW